MFDNFTWPRGSGELSLIDSFAELARKASEEAGADVMVVLNFPEGYLSVVASTPTHPAGPEHTWTPRAVAQGLRLLRQWFRNLGDGGDDPEIREEIARFQKR